MMKKNSKVLALKYRPQSFEDLIGQDVVGETILNSIKLNKNFIDPYKNLFKLNLKIGNFNSAIENGKKIIDLDVQKNSIAYFN